MSYFNNHVFCCTNERPENHPRGSCAAGGSKGLRTYMAGRMKELGISSTRINASGCMDQCEQGPVLVIYPDAVWYRYETEADIDDILQTHLVDGEIVERLRLMPDAAVDKAAEGK